MYIDRKAIHGATDIIRHEVNMILISIGYREGEGDLWAGPALMHILDAAKAIDHELKERTYATE